MLNSVKKISEELNIETPRVYSSNFIRNNAYAENRSDKKIIVISENLLNSLSQSQLDLVLRHEMFHLKFGGKNVVTLNELLCDSFSVLGKNNFHEMKDIIHKITAIENPPLLAGFHECFITTEKRKETNKDKNEIQKQRRESFENDSFLRRLVIFEMQYQEGNPYNWVDALHSTNNKKQKIIYDKDARLEFLSDLQMMCEMETEIETTPHARKMLELPKGDIVLQDMWHKFFRIYGVNEKLLNQVFTYIKEHENKFNLRDCAKKIQQPDFVILLIILNQLMYQKIVLKWRFPCRYNFDY